jgi:hypothetical protein
MGEGPTMSNDKAGSGKGRRVADRRSAERRSADGSAYAGPDRRSGDDRRAAPDRRSGPDRRSTERT